MIDPRTTYRKGAFFLGLSGIILIVPAIVTATFGLLVVTLIGLALAYAMLHDSRAAAYLAFFFSALSMMIAIARIWVPPDWIGWSFAVSAAGFGSAALFLLAALWKSPAKETTRPST